jgi:hypothetical protein
MSEKKPYSAPVLREVHPRLFVSTFPYALIKHARALGELEGGPEQELALIRQHEQLRGESAWPAYRTVGELDNVEPFVLVSDASGSISQSRSRMAGRFWRGFGSECDVWLSVDDDIFADRSVLARLVAECRRTGGMVSVPYLLRDGKTASVSGVHKVHDEVLCARTSGMGLVAMHRNAIEALAPSAPRAIDDKGARYPALFLEFIDEWLGWLGEDIAFSHRMAALHMLWHLLPDAPVCHAGRWSRLNADGTFSADRASVESGGL